MTIKRRLFFSNVLMIVIPILLGVLLSAIITNLILSRMGVGDVTHADSNLFYRVVQQLGQARDDWENVDSSGQILADMQEWGIPSESGAVTIAVFEGEREQAALGEFPGGALVEMALAQPDHQHFTMDHASLYTISVGRYRLFLHNSNYEYGQAGYVDDPDARPIIGVMIMGIIVAVIVATNRLLTHYVFKSIVTPLDTLVNGVHEIRDGNLHYRIAYAGKDEFAAVCADFNDMARQIQELMAARQRNDENRRELIAGISHDLRTPLTAIIAYAEGLTSGVITQAAMQKEYLNTIAGKAKDLEHIISQLFQFSRLDVGDFPVAVADVNLGEALATYVGEVGHEYMQRGLTLALDDMPDGIVVCADPVQLRGVFANLLENSLKYGDQKDCKVQIGCRRAGAYAEIIFTDNGPGVPEAYLAKLFDIFYRTDTARQKPEQGSGLGLAISERIVRRLGGEIRAENAQNSGLRVVITLPVI